MAIRLSMREGQAFLSKKGLEQGDKLRIENVIKSLKVNNSLVIQNLSKNISINATYDLTERQKDIIFAGGLLNYTRENQ